MTGTGSPHVAVTGAGGFIGGAVVGRLAERGIDCTALYRDQIPAGSPPAGRWIDIGSLELAPDLASALAGVDVVVHAAARVHVTRDPAASPLAAYRAANTEGTLHLARHAEKAGVGRFIFLSSIKVNGEETAPGVPFRASDVARPSDPYAISKHEAEQGLLEMARHSAMDVVIIRPPLVYGPGVRANFANIMKWLETGLPIPLGGIDNRRTLLALPGLVDLIELCLTHPAAGGRAWLAGDGEDLSTSELIRRVAAALGRPARLVTLPRSMVSVAANALGKRGALRRLYGNLQVDTAETRGLLGWMPLADTQPVLRATARHFRARGGKVRVPPAA